MTESSYTDLMTSLVTATKTIFPDNKVIVANLSEREPDGPYISIRLIRDTQSGLAYQDTLLNSNNIMQTRVNYEALVQFSFISIDPTIAANLAKKFIQYLNTAPTREVFRKNKLSKLSSSSIRNVATKRETVWSQIYNVDVTFIYSIMTEQAMTPITTVQVEDITGEVVYTVPPDVVIP